MCGIFGGLRYDGKNWTDYEKVFDLLKHRGPDDQGVFAENAVLLGNTRLAIQDIEHGSQPFVSDCGSIVLVQNGEIYNYIELRQELVGLGKVCRTNCDTEVLVHLYEAFGLDFVKKLNGMFAIALFDKRVQKMYLIRDRLGVKPLFYISNGNSFGFASEIKGLLKLLNAPRILNLEALSDYFSFNYVPPPLTLFKGIFHVPPGSILTVSDYGLEIEKWWDLSCVSVTHHELTQQWCHHLVELLADATRIRMRADTQWGAFLSGGLDSSTVLALMRRASDSKFLTFSIGFNDIRYDESEFARQAASMFGVDLILERVEEDLLDRWPSAVYYSDQPHGDVSFLPTWRVSELAASHCKVVLSGDGGDELFGGYTKYLEFFNRNSEQNFTPDEFVTKYLPKISLFSPDQKHLLFDSDIDQSVKKHDSSQLVRDIVKDCKHYDPINWALLIDTKLLLPGNNLVKPDRMGMAASLEVRSPFLDYRVAEFAFASSGSFKISNNETKYALKRAVAPLIGDGLAYRKKQMFTVPVGEWFRKHRREYCRSELKFLGKTGLVNNNYINSLFNDHVSGTKNYTRELRALVALAHWWKTFDLS